MNKINNKGFLERPSVIRGLWIFLYACCAATLIPDFFTHREAHFVIDGIFGFHALLGFASCAVLILLSKVLGLFLKVNEDYYDK
ncbi:MAG: hypothetical protein DRH12_07345 [Deltaproteobacteria bacterium]|nr:MAG: hypothetical protein DRH12_07345 [Deltaproteobacteria bacterium]